MMRRLILLGVLAAAGPAIAHPLTPSDLVSLAQIGDAAVSQDGRWLVWAQSDESPAPGRPQHRLWRLDLNAAGAAPQALPAPDGTQPSSPEFSADGRLYFLADGASRPGGLYRMAMDDLAPRQVDGVQGLAGFRMSPTGDSVLGWADRPPHARSLDDALRAPDQPGGARTYDQLPIRHWDRWEDGTRSQLFVIPVGSGAAAAASCAVAPSLVADVPSKPNGGREEVAWAPDGRTIYFALRKAGRIEPLSTNFDIYVKSLAGCAEPPANLTAGNLAADETPVVSPDGRWLAWLAASRPGYADDRRVVWLRNLATGQVRPLTQAWDRSADAIVWSADSRTLYVTAYESLDHPIFSLGLADGAVRRLTAAGHTTLVAARRDGGLVFEKDGLVAPPNFWLRTAAGEEKQLTAVNAAALAGIDWPQVTRFTFSGAARQSVQGLSLRPPGLARGAKAPTVLVVHGGPQSTLGDAWYPRWPLNLALYASHGYGVVSVDFHGSLGHGQAFTDSVNRDWGGKPLVDLQRGLAAAIARFDYLDGTQACAVGASFGGFMMNWIEGHWPTRFRCLVQHDGVFDERGMTYETDELAQDRWDFGDRPYYADPKPYERWNPVNSVARWRTPELVITGEQDFRSPTGQAIAAFTALQERNIASRLLVFPGEGHFEAKAADSLQWYREAFDWIDRWIRPARGSTSPTPSG